MNQINYINQIKSIAVLIVGRRKLTLPQSGMAFSVLVFSLIFALAYGRS